MFVVGHIIVLGLLIRIITGVGHLYGVALVPRDVVMRGSGDHARALLRQLRVELEERRARDRVVHYPWVCTQIGCRIDLSTHREHYT